MSLFQIACYAKREALDNGAYRLSYRRKFWDLFAKTGAKSQIVQSRVVACEPQTGV